MAITPAQYPWDLKHKPLAMDLSGLMDTVQVAGLACGGDGAGDVVADMDIHTDMGEDGEGAVADGGGEGLGIGRG